MCSNRIGTGSRFTNPVVRTGVEVDVALRDALHQQILAIERQINTQVPEHDPVAVHLLRSIPGVGNILALVIFYEIHGINRFPKVGNFISYARLVKCTHEAAGKRYHQRLVSNYGKAKALSIISSVARAYRIHHAQKEDPFRCKAVF